MGSFNYGQNTPSIRKIKKYSNKKKNVKVSLMDSIRYLFTKLGNTSIVRID